MTADFYPYDMSFLARAAARIINEVKGVNRVVTDVTSSRRGRSSGNDFGPSGAIPQRPGNLYTH